MNKLLLYIIVFICSTEMLSCKKQKIRETYETVNVTIKANAVYVYDLGYSCPECGVGISRQATHYQTSLIKLGNSLKYSYQYTPLQNYVGNDEVELKFSQGSDGSSPNNSFHYLTIKFTITN